MIKWVCHPDLIFEPGKGSNPWAKSIPNNPNAGIKIRIPKPADLLRLNGLKVVKLS